MMRTNKIAGYCHVLLVLAALLTPLACQAQTLKATGTLNASVDNWQGIGIVFNSDPSGVVLSGTGSSNATLNFGTVSAFGAVPAGVTAVRGTGNFTISSLFDVYVNHGGNDLFGSNNFTLSVSLASNSAPFTYKLGSTTLTTTQTTISSNDTRYGTNVPYTLAITIPSTASAQTIVNTVNFSVVAN